MSKRDKVLVVLILAGVGYFLIRALVTNAASLNQDVQWVRSQDLQPAVHGQYLQPTENPQQQ